VLVSTEEHKRRALTAQAIRGVAFQMRGDDEDLLKAVTKCLAHFTHGGGTDVALQVRGDDGLGFERLVELMRHPRRSVWEAAMASLVNLSHLEAVRPNLGNAGVVAVMVEKVGAT
jgi:hypothetical protein